MDAVINVQANEVAGALHIRQALDEVQRKRSGTALHCADESHIEDLMQLARRQAVEKMIAIRMEDHEVLCPSRIRIRLQLMDRAISSCMRDCDIGKHLRRYHYRLFPDR